jgi:AhpD family alkylhydroperoxidase
MPDTPRHYQKLQQRYKAVMDSLNQLGKALHEAGPLDEKQSQLVQLAAAAGQRSEGAVHSHTRRAMKAGATPEEVRHTLVLLISTLGYPTVAAALSWADDILEQ